MDNKKLIGNRVLVEVARKEEETAHGLIVVASEGSAADIRTGKVVAVGTGKDTDQGHVDIKVGVGDEIMFEYGKAVLVDGKEYYLVGGDDVIMVLNVTPKTS